MITKKIKPLKLSIIIPIYNVEKYVEKCLSSCIEQDIPHSDYEIIIINDGTIDNSLAIVERIAQEYSNIIVISQMNAGLSVARNKGLSLAKGEYVWFIDSDDWIETNCLRKITNLLFEFYVDGLMICASDMVNWTPIRRQDYSSLSGQIYPGIELLRTNNWSPCVPFTIYRRDFLNRNNLRFFEGIFHEDSEFTPRSYFYAERIAVTNDIIYFVFKNPSSITRSLNPKKAFDSIVVAKSLDIFSQIVPTSLRYIYNNFISICINNSLNNSYQMDKVTIQNLNRELKESRSLLKHLQRSTIFKYRLESILFYIFPNHCVQIYKFIQLINKNHQKLSFVMLVNFNLQSIPN